MSFLTRSLSALTALTIGLGGVALPAKAYETGSHEDHVELWNTVRESGVATYINPEECFEGDLAGVDGFYISGYGVLVVCQDNATTPGEVVHWTANDYDTLRHEVVHLIQDCKDGRGDGSLIPILGLDELSEFAVQVLGREAISAIIQTYSERGADRDTIIFEIEAFAMARAIPASTISEGVKTYCGV